MFDGAKNFGCFSAAVVGGSIIALGVTGLWGPVGVAVALYVVLVYFNRLERRDNRDDRLKRRRRK